MSEQDDWRNRPPEQGGWPSGQPPYPGQQPGYGNGQPGYGGGQPGYGPPPNYPQQGYGQGYPQQPPPYGAPGYGPYPGGPGYGAPVDPPGRPPRSVEVAFFAMLLRAALGIVGVIVTYATKTGYRNRIISDHPDYDPQRVSDVLNHTVAVTTVGAVVGVLISLALAWMVRNGVQWARVVTWVFAGITVLATFGSLDGEIPAGLRAVTVIGGVVAVVVIVALAVAPTNAYYRQVAASRRRY